jgi:hypothetical protein
MIRRSVPSPKKKKESQSTHPSNKKKQGGVSAPIRQESDLVAKHGGAAAVSTPTLPTLGGLGEEHVLFAAITLIKFVTVYSQRARH